MVEYFSLIVWKDGLTRLRHRQVPIDIYLPPVITYEEILLYAGFHHQALDY